MNAGWKPAVRGVGIGGKSLVRLRAKAGAGALFGSAEERAEILAAIKASQKKKS